MTQIIEKAINLGQEVKNEIENAEKPKNEWGQAFGRHVNYYAKGVAYMGVGLIALEAAKLTAAAMVGPAAIVPYLAAPVAAHYAVNMVVDQVGLGAEKTAYAAEARMGII